MSPCKIIWEGGEGQFCFLFTVDSAGISVEEYVTYVWVESIIGYTDLYILHL